MLISQGHGTATHIDVQNARTATDFLMRNKSLFTVARFMACLDYTSIAYNSLSAAIFGNAPCANISVEESQELIALRQQVQKLTFDKNALELKQNQVIAAEVAKGIKSLKVPNDGSAKEIFKFSNPASVNPHSSSPINPSSNAFSAPSNGASSSGSSLSNLEAQLSRLSRIVEQNILNKISSTVPLKPITKDPPTYNRQKHGSMIKFGRKQFCWWARGQCLSARCSVQFFCLCFEHDIERTHVDKLAIDVNGNIKFGSVGPLIERVIQDLQFDEETGEQLRLKFDLFRAKAGTKLDAEFMRCLELREEG